MDARSSAKNPGARLIAPVRFSSSDFPASKRLELVRAVLAREIMRFDIEPRADQPLEVDVTICSLPGISVATNRFSASFNRHSSGMIEDDDPVLSIVTEGTCTWQQEGRNATLHSGQGLLTTRGAPGTLERHTVSRIVNLRMPRTVLQSHVPDYEDLLIQPDAIDPDMLHLLVSYVRILDEEQALGIPEVRGTVALHFQDLVVLALRRKRSEQEAGNGLKAARLKAIKDDVAAHLDHRDLSIGWLAGRHALSERSIRALFQAAGTTFTDYMLDQRLIRAHRLFRHPLHSTRPISEIAFSCGFGDLSYFNRVFRRRFGETPTDTRARAK